MVCHGGLFPRPRSASGQPVFTPGDAGSANLDSRFIPFDLRGLTLPNVSVPGVGVVDFKASQQQAFKTLNQQIVAATDLPSQPQEVIARMYTALGGAPGASTTQIESFVTSGWQGGAPRFDPKCEPFLGDIEGLRRQIADLQADLAIAPTGEKGFIAKQIKQAQADLDTATTALAACVSANPIPTMQEELYDKVVGPSCRSCHLSLAPRVQAPSRSWELASDFNNFRFPIETRVCRTHEMPHSVVTHNLFWFSRHPHQPRLLHEYFNDGLVAPGTCVQPPLTPAATPTPTPAPPQVQVPDVIGERIKDARTAMAAAGLAVTQTATIDPTCNFVGLVISQSPGGGAQVAAGSTVKLRIGGPPTNRPCQ
jgi:hypothetical protein